MTVTATDTTLREYALTDRYDQPQGEVFLTGVQALARLLLDQHRADALAGRRTGTLVSGYQGSPLGGFDQEMARLGDRLAEHEIVLRPAVNEELGATAVWGSQLTATLPGPRCDGVLGVWYGKAPGVDRAADAIRHGNHVGTDPRGGVLALCGDDPASKSSTIPGASESLLAALDVPVFAPGDVQEVLDLGRHAIACSRVSGLWSALKVVTNVADAAASVGVGAGRVVPVMPTLEVDGVPFVHAPSAQLLPPASLALAATLPLRLQLATLYARANGVNRIVRAGDGARVGVIAAGETALNLDGALTVLGLDGGAPVRTLALGMIFPLDSEIVRAFATGLDEIVVLEEKGPFLERLVRDALYGGPATPPVLGKRDERGAALVPASGTLAVDAIAEIVGARLLAHARDGELEPLRARLDALRSAPEPPAVDLGAARTPFFCSGCPHNTSVAAPDDAIVGAGIGCHTMVVIAPGPYGQVKGLTQMGGEGAQWIGAAPFVDVPHFLQNLGDGTFHHSGSLAIRAAIAADLNVTYKLLVNGTVAMTGGQDVPGGMGVPAIVASLQAEGVARVVVTTDDPSRYADVTLPGGAQVRHRREIFAVQRELAAVAGVTVLIHEQPCATELRRERKRGRAPEPPQRVVINERVCEGCGDCGAKSGCLSVEPVETEFGRKTRVNQTTCNKDFSCLAGDCPSFLTVIGPDGATRRTAAATPPTFELPEPPRHASGDVRIRLVGIGGTGVVTVSQTIGVAALLDGRHVSGLDSTGLSQKAGPVVSDVRVTEGPVREGVGMPAGSADLLLGLDLLGAAAPRNLRAAARERTVAVVSDSIVPTGEMVVDVRAAAPDGDAARTAIDDRTRASQNVYLDAVDLSERLLGDALPANTVVLGAALQAGALPVSLRALREAIRLGGVAVSRNLAALDLGRAWVADPDAVQAALAALDVAPAPVLAPDAAALVDRVTSTDGELRRLLAVRVPDLIAWGGVAVARRYVDAVARVRARETERVPGSEAVSEEVARGLHRLLAYKDEYEVARLQVEGLRELEPGSRVTYHLHPPLLRSLGLERKLALGPWFTPALRALSHGRRLRGTVLDPFGRAEVRRVERALPDEYLGLVDAALAALAPATLGLAVEAARSADIVRGYEQIKLDNVARFRARAVQLRAELSGGAASDARDVQLTRGRS